MMTIINTNVLSLNAQRNLSSNSANLATSINRLSTGMRVNSAKDDAAGLAISERMSAQSRGMEIARRNANDAVSLAQTAEGALGSMNGMLQRMRELAIQSTNATNSSTDRTALQNEFNQLQTEITRTANTTRFNGNLILTQTTSFDFQIGSNATTNDQISVSALNVLSTTTSANSDVGALARVTNATCIDISTVGVRGSAAGAANFAAYGAVASMGTGALGAVEVLDFALAQVNSARSTFGAVQNRFDAVISNLNISIENQAAARSRIVDTDYARETATLARAQVLQQAGIAMLSQANAAPNQVLSLLR
ncbi:MAG: flagellin FliC [Betaproteobacteria bacterium]|nr:flagellin FliC [Betaproteobacteria bacterium]